MWSRAGQETAQMSGMSVNAIVVAVSASKISTKYKKPSRIALEYVVTSSYTHPKRAGIH